MSLFKIRPSVKSGIVLALVAGGLILASSLPIQGQTSSRDGTTSMRTGAMTAAGTANRGDGGGNPVSLRTLFRSVRGGGGGSTPPVPDFIDLDCGGGVTLRVLRIEAGIFDMGISKSDPLQYNTDELYVDEKDRHQVTISKRMYVGETEVTQQQFTQVTGTNPSNNVGANLPVESITYAQATAFCTAVDALNADMTVRLPTEAEWEYACRGRNSGRYYFGTNTAFLGNYGWYDANSGGTTQAVKGKLPNAYGLYDMHGNVYEICSDWYDANYYTPDPKTDPQGPDTQGTRGHTARGGSYADPDLFARSSFRNYTANDASVTFTDYGFRVVVIRDEDN